MAPVVLDHKADMLGTLSIVSATTTTRKVLARSYHLYRLPTLPASTQKEFFDESAVILCTLQLQKFTVVLFRHRLILEGNIPHLRHLTTDKNEYKTQAFQHRMGILGGHF